MKVSSIEELIAYNNAIDDSEFLENIASSREIANALSTVFTYSEIINNPKKLDRMSFVVDVSRVSYLEKMRLLEVLKTKFKAFIQKKGM